MKVLTAAQMREADRLTTERYGISGLQLMENAGAAITEFLREKFAGLARRKIVVLCGKGNNGGDGLVVARLLKESGCSPGVVLFSDPGAVQGDAGVNLKRWQQGLGELRVVTSSAEWESARMALDDAHLIVDALLGTGLRGPAEGLLGSVITDLNAARARSDGKGATLSVISVDMPSGLSSDALARDPASHKGSYGHALIVAGSLGKSGAAVLAARGALRSGAGLVTVATPLDALPMVAAGAPEMMTAPLAATEAGTASLGSFDYGRFGEIVRDKSVIAVGPGLSTHAETQQFIRAILAETDLPIVLDADGLNAYAGIADHLNQRHAPALVLTPHPGEMARLLGVTTKDVQARRLDVALEAAGRWRAYVVLKGFHTILATPSGIAYINTTGNPGMATGGTGDVLTGILAGLTAQFGIEDWARVLGFGVYLHGLAGDIAASRVGLAPLIASDLIEAIPEAYSRILAEWEHGR
jgi:hydroxyethylthiazole kinase-like uncharacterized protein yjeF